MKFGVRILPKKGFLDPQGRAVHSLLQKEHSDVMDVSVGRWIEISVNDSNPDVALKKVNQIAQSVLVNPMTESFEVEKLN